MACTGAGSPIVHGCLGAFRRAACESDLGSFHGDSGGSSNENIHFSSSESDRGHENPCSLSHSEANPDGELNANDARACYHDINGAGSLACDSASHANSASNRYTDHYPDSRPIAYAGSERACYPGGTHPGGAAGDRRPLTYTHPDADRHAYNFLHTHIHCHADAFIHSHTHSVPVGDTLANAYSNSINYTISNGLTDFASDIYIYVDADRYAYSIANSHPDAASLTHCDTDRFAHAYLPSYPDAFANSDTDFHLNQHRDRYTDCLAFTHSYADTIRNQHRYGNADSNPFIHSNLYIDNYPIIDLNRYEHAGPNANVLTNTQPHCHIHADGCSNPDTYARQHVHVDVCAIGDGFGNSFANENSHTKAHNHTDLHAAPIKNIDHHCNCCANRFADAYGYLVGTRRSNIYFDSNTDGNAYPASNGDLDDYTEPCAVPHTYTHVRRDYSLLHR